MIIRLEMLSHSFQWMWVSELLKSLYTYIWVRGAAKPLEINQAIRYCFVWCPGSSQLHSSKIAHIPLCGIFCFIFTYSSICILCPFIYPTSVSMWLIFVFSATLRKKFMLIWRSSKPLSFVPVACSPFLPDGGTTLCIRHSQNPFELRSLHSYITWRIS